MAKKEAMTTQQLLSSIKVNVSEFINSFRGMVHLNAKMPSFTKKGPGRYHRQGVQKYKPRQQEYSKYRSVDGVRLW